MTDKPCVLISTELREKEREAKQGTEITRDESMSFILEIFKMTKGQRINGTEQDFPSPL